MQFLKFSFLKPSLFIYIVIYIYLNARWNTLVRFFTVNYTNLNKKLNNILVPFVIENMLFVREENLVV